MMAIDARKTREKESGEAKSRKKSIDAQG